MGKNGRRRIWQLSRAKAANCGSRQPRQYDTNKFPIKNTPIFKKIQKKIKTQIKDGNKNWKTKKNEKTKKNKKISKNWKTTKSSKITGISAAFLTSALNCFPNFIGCIPENELSNIVFNSLPCFIIVNIDSGNLPGSHWITLGIFPKSIEIFDSLGFDIFNWSRVPCTLLNFVHRLSVTRKVIVSPRIQSDYSTLCGFYCLFYMFMRYHTCMKSVLSYFGSKFSCNDSVLLKFFS